MAENIEPNTREMTADEIAATIPPGKRGIVWHKLGEMLHGEKTAPTASSVHTLDEGSGNTPTPPSPPKTPPKPGN